MSAYAYSIVQKTGLENICQLLPFIKDSPFNRRQLWHIRCILSYGPHRKWCEQRKIERSCVAFHTISGVVRSKTKRTKSSVEITEPGKIPHAYA